MTALISKIQQKWRYISTVILPALKRASSVCPLTPGALSCCVSGPSYYAVKRLCAEALSHIWVRPSWTLAQKSVQMMPAPVTTRQQPWEDPSENHPAEPNQLIELSEITLHSFMLLWKRWVIQQLMAAILSTGSGCSFKHINGVMPFSHKKCGSYTPIQWG